MPLSTDFDIEVQFNLKDNIPNFIFTDTNDYAAEGDALVSGLLKVTSPSGQVIYITPGDTPDFLPGTLSFDGVKIPTDVKGQIIEGEYCFEYTAATQNSSSRYFKKKCFTYNFCSPKVVIETSLDCFVARLLSRDNTVYTVNGITPNRVRVHELHYPSILDQSPLSSNSGLHEVKFPNLFEGTYTTKITSTLTYDFGDNVFICTQIEGQKDSVVQCDLNLCRIYCCVKSLKERVDELKRNHRRNYEGERKKLVEVIGLMVLFEQASKCGKNEDADNYLNLIKKIADCKDGCGCGTCGQNDSEGPKQINPFIASVNSSGTNKWISGTGAPSNILGIDTDFYIDTVLGDIYEKVGGAWVKLLNLKGKDGKDGVSTEWFADKGVPDASIGKDNDLYLDTDKGDIYQMQSGVWGNPVSNLKGPQGIQGVPGIGGPGPQGPPGKDAPLHSVVMYVGSNSNFNSTGLGISGDVVGWAKCNGNNGTIDMRSRFPVGLNPTDEQHNIIGKLGGAKSVTLSLNQIPSHDHNVSVNSNSTGVSTAQAGNHYHNSKGTERWDKGSGSGSDLGPHYSSGGQYSLTNSTGNHTHTINDPGHGHSVNESSRGGNQSHENRPPFFTIEFIQKIS